MKYLFKTVFTLAILTILAANYVQAETQREMVVAVKTHDFELTETDISSLVVGEAKTIETESGKIIDILRTADGVELYVDGELLEMNLDDHDLHEKHMVRKHVEIDCDNGEDCEKNVVVLSGDLEEIHEMHKSGDAHKVIVIKKEIVTED